MTEVTSIPLSHQFQFAPERITEVNQPVPVVGDYIPVRVLQEQLAFRLPVVKRVGEHAVSLSLGGPFGFAHGIPNSRINLTQKTDFLKLESSRDASERWRATVETAHPLTQQDVDVFSLGVETYALYVANRLAREGKLYP